MGELIFPDFVTKSGLARRFWAKANVGGFGCWEWRASLSKSGGYGQFYADRTMRRAHRVAYELANGPIPDGMHVLHRCDNRKCVNPGHLFVGTNGDNVADRQAKKRQAVGSKHGAAKLTEADVAEILESAGTQDAVAKRFGVARSQISMIRSGKTWSHVGVSRG